MMEDFVFHFCVAVNRAITKRTPIITPVAISRAKSHTGFGDLAGLLDSFSGGLCFVLTSEWAFVVGAPPDTQVSSLL